MHLTHILAILGTAAIAAGQSDSKAVIINPATANWTHQKNDSPGSESVMIRADQTTGGMDLLVRFPAGHVIPPHFHDSNERIFVAEGQLTLAQETASTHIDAGGFAYLPAHEIQRLSCTSKTRCTFYLSWDGKFASHPAR
jgi:quercetin dioxygenase-like cupin family protein